MGRKINYPKFLEELDKRIESYFKAHSDFVCCKAGCSACCEKGDYPISDIELEYLMLGFANLNMDKKRQVQDNFKKMEKGGKCPFLLDNLCSIYKYRPIICRTHGLAYVIKDGKVKLPYCVNEGKNYAKAYKSDAFFGEPINENLDTSQLLKDYDIVIRNLYDWVNGLP